MLLTRFLQGLLYGVDPLDTTTFVGVGVVLLVAALVAALVPARHVTRTAPAEVLRSD